MQKGVDYIGITVVFYCHDGKGNVLLNKRSKHCRDEQGRWDCGGGSMKVGETFEQAVRREIMEEYCCEPVSLQFAGVNNVLRKSRRKQTHWIALLFAAQLDQKKVKIGDPDKMEKIGWFTIDTLPSPLHSKYLEHLEYIKKADLL